MMTNPLEKVSIKNHLGLFNENGDPILERVADFLSISHKELAGALNLSIDQIRPKRISQAATERITELAGILEFIADVFSGDRKKSLFWIKTPNPHFGGLSARDLILRGHQKKVKLFVMAAVRKDADSLKLDSKTA